jgi:hypothetical protein
MFMQYKGMEMQQRPEIFPIFKNFLDKQQFDLIIEIGTRQGAFTRFLKDASPSSRVVSFDILQQVPQYLLDIFSHDIDLRIKNVFSEDFEKIIDEDTLKMLNDTGKKLILCDGGNKIKEFNCLAKYLNVGDFIMAHDYSPSVEYFEKNIIGKIWDWCETTEEPISAISNECGLEFYEQDKFQKIVWVCKKKVK